MSRTIELSIAGLAKGGMRVIRSGDREILVCRSQAGVFALDNTCTHADARLSEGRLRGTRVICPLHGASFDVRDGRALGSPATQALATYPVRLEGERALIEVCGGEQADAPSDGEATAAAEEKRDRDG